jgi:hypothetical protein
MTEDDRGCLSGHVGGACEDEAQPARWAWWITTLGVSDSGEWRIWTQWRGGEVARWRIGAEASGAAGWDKEESRTQRAGGRGRREA